jgi:hypothetical protein
MGYAFVEGETLREDLTKNFIFCIIHPRFCVLKGFSRTQMTQLREE